MIIDGLACVCYRPSEVSCSLSVQPQQQVDNMTPLQKAPRKAVWLVSESKMTPEHLVSFIEQLDNIEVFAGPTDVTIEFEGSILGQNLTGNIAQVIEDFNGLSDKTFATGVFRANYPQHNACTIVLNLNFAQRLLNVTLKNAAHTHAEQVVEALRQIFPQETGFTHQELEDKAARLAGLAKQLEDLRLDAANVKQTKTEAENNLNEIQANKEAADASFVELNKRKTDIEQLVTEVTQLHKQSKQTSAHLDNIKTKIEADRNSVQQSRDDVATKQGGVTEFFKEIETHRQNLKDHENNVTAIKDRTSSIVDEMNTRTTNIVTENEELQKEIKEHLLKAVGASLFGAFQKRKTNIVISKWIWAGATGAAFILQAIAVVWLAKEAGAISEAATQVAGEAASLKPFYAQPMFILKSTVTLPILALIIFCAKQYTRERDYEELYAFKSALSFSLAPYLDLVRNVSVEEHSTEYSQFIVHTISQVFDDPLAKLKTDKKHSKKDFKSLQGIIDSLKDFAKTCRP